MRSLMAAAVLWFCVDEIPGQTQRRFDVWRLFAPSSYVGLGIMDIDNEKAESIGLIEPHGVEVTSVASDSPAERAGLERGDIVVAWRGVRIEGIEHFAHLVRETPVGRGVELSLFRGGNKRAVRVQVGQRSRSAVRAVGECVACLPAIPDVPRPHIAMQSRVLGAELEAVDGQLAEFFGVRQGVLVRSVDRRSAAESAGLQAGDVIVAVAGKPVGRTRSVSQALLSAAPERVPVEVMRNRRKRMLELAPAARSRVGAGPVRRVVGRRGDPKKEIRD